MVTRNLHPKIDLHCVPLLLRLVSLEEVVRILSIIHIAADLLPSSLVNEVNITCLIGKVHCVIAPHQ